MLIDLNSIAKACWQKQYSTTDEPDYDMIDTLTEDNLQYLVKHISGMIENNSYFEFKSNLAQAIQEIFAIAYIKNINLNDFFNISLNTEN